MHTESLVKLTLSSSWALLKYHIKALGTTKTQGFRQNLYRFDSFLHPQRLSEHFSGLI